MSTGTGSAAAVASMATCVGPAARTVIPVPWTTTP